MQPSQIQPGILRNSYGFQMSEQNSMRSPTGKVYINHTSQFMQPQMEQISNTIKHMENKIEGVENLVKKKSNVNQLAPQISQPAKFDLGGSKFNSQFTPNSQDFRGEEPFTEAQLRGSCQNILKKFDYSNLRNTTHFNPMSKFGNPETKKNHDETNNFKNSYANKTIILQSSNSFLKPNEKIKLQNKNSFINGNSRTPTKIINEKSNIDYQRGGGQSKTPTKYKNIFENSPKLINPIKNVNEPQQKKTFKSLNQIIECKNKEKMAQQSVKNQKRSKVVNGFELGPVLGKGKFGQVFLSKHVDTSFIVAIKKIQKKKVLEFKMVDQFSKQIRLHSSLDHPNIVKFFGFFEQKQDIYLIMEYMNGGTLFDYLNQVTCMQVKEAVQYLRDIIQALNYMHERSVAHRDIKPQNIVISSEGVAKLCDFGWSAVVETSRKTYCGTFDYAPPEILERKNYDTSVDIWCIGVLTYELLTGRCPFEGDKRNIIMEKIVNVDKHKIQYPVELPAQAKQFIECLVQKDPNMRPKCQDLLKFKLFSLYPSKGNKSKKIH